MLTVTEYKKRRFLRRSFWHMTYAANSPNGQQGIATTIPTKTKREAVAEQARITAEYEGRGWKIETTIDRPGINA
jgi:hypothetical protein